MTGRAQNKQKTYIKSQTEDDWPCTKETDDIDNYHLRQKIFPCILSVNLKKKIILTPFFKTRG